MRLIRTLASLGLALIAWHSAGQSTVLGDGPPGLDATTRAALSDTLRGVLVECIPEKIEVKDDWGETKAGFSGLTFRRDGLKLDVIRRTKDVNHGLWKMVAVEPVDVQQNLQFKILVAQPNGPQGFSFRILVSAPLHVTARLERWRHGVKLLNGSTEADATIEMQVDGDLQYRFDVNEQGTYLALSPRVPAVDLRLVNFDWQRIGTLDGDLVHEIGDVFSKPIAEQLDRQEGKAVEKINKAIAKRQEKWRVPLTTVFDLSRWKITDGVPQETPQ